MLDLYYLPPLTYILTLHLTYPLPQHRCQIFICGQMEPQKMVPRPVKSMNKVQKYTTIIDTSFVPSNTPSLSAPSNTPFHTPSHTLSAPSNTPREEHE